MEKQINQRGRSNMGKTDLKIFFALLGIGSLLFIILRVIGFDGLYGQDAYEYIHQAKEVKHALLNLSKPNDFYWAPGYPLFVAIIDLIVGNINLSAQILSVITWSITVFFCWKAFVGIKPSKFSLVLTVVIVGLSAYFFRVFFTSMSDGLMTMAITCAIYCLKRYRQRLESIYSLGAVFFSSMAVFTRYAALPIGALIVCYCFVLMLRDKKWKASILSASILAVSVLVFFTLKTNSADQIVQNSIIKNWSFSNYWSTTFTNNQGNLNYFVPNIVYVTYPFTHLGFVWVSIPVILLGIIKGVKPQFPWLIIVASVYLLFLAGIPFQNKRFLVPVIPMVFIFLVPYFVNYLQKSNKKVILFSIITLCVSNLILSSYSFQTIYQIQQNDVLLSKQINTYPIQQLYTFEVDLAIKSRGFEGSITNLWTAKEVSLASGDYVLINYEKWEKQWAHHQLMKNVNFILSQEDLVLVDSFDNDWKLWKYE